ncbi:DUF805 domain-containing protein [Botryobacter ruber]|uniref:DUF805 domain-containing protein n=1 Tax=Botryobacter ruber TaxID=2171629 RepID=UPI00196B67DD|nr:DUF805 domain-containing protein [Botryobacter ruber]
MSNIFSFSGRIRRTEYAVTQILLSIITTVIFFGFGMAAYLAGEQVSAGIVVLVSATFLFATWISLAAGAKRCHDRGNSGFFQLIPFYSLWMLFGDGDAGRNMYGPDPKGRVGQAEMMESMQAKAAV